jgi:hypothetical protein
VIQDPIPASCPYCGEAVEVTVDTGGGARQRYIEDCPVCCRPWQVEVVWLGADGWSATLQTTDE